MTAEARAEALVEAMAVRQERREVLTALKAGEIQLRDVLKREDDVVGRIRARRLLEALPGVGSVGAGRILSELGIAESRRVQGIGPRQRERLLELFPLRK
ncbi:integration host factor, actinobacterial type [Streptomyces sp. NPDC002659]|uniref:integration host factor, actinobacterial type n=1 Tax=Streptomyces sp. NPDC002659 TaxID=3364656 RepID=UPI0036C88D27